MLFSNRIHFFRLDNIEELRCCFDPDTPWTLVHHSIAEAFGVHSYGSFFIYITRNYASDSPEEERENPLHPPNQHQKPSTSSRAVRMPWWHSRPCGR